MLSKADGRFRMKGDVHVKEFDGELVILDLAKGEYYGVNALGARLWQGLERGESCNRIADALVLEYEVERDVLVSDLLDLLEEFESRGWMEASPQRAAP